MSISCKNFWLKLKKKAVFSAKSLSGDSAETLCMPILALAPMAGITDSAFRVLCRQMGADVVYSEMVSADALYYDSKKTIEMLKIDKKEHPVVAQLFGKRPELFGKAAHIAMEAGADGIDINFGCPAKKVVRHSGGVSLMWDLSLCKEIVQSVLDAVDIPVSVKIRTGINANQPQSFDGAQREFHPASRERRGRHGSTRKSKVTALDFVKNIIDLPIAAIMIHGRTYEQGFSGEVDYEMIRSVVELAEAFSCRNEAMPRSYNGTGGNIIILGNGGIKTPEDAKKMLEKTGADGLGLAQGVLGKPWLFGEIKDYIGKNANQRESESESTRIRVEEIKKIALKHARLAYKMKGAHGIIEMRKHLLWYVKGWANAKELREKLVRVESVDDVKRVLNI